MAIRKVVGNAAVRQGKVTLDIVPPLIENGNTGAAHRLGRKPDERADHVRAIPSSTERTATARLQCHAGARKQGR